MNIILALFAALTLIAASTISATPLDDYMALPDPNYKVEFLNKSFDAIDYTGYLYKLTSQAWLTPEFSTCTVWTHTLVLIVPNTLDKAMGETALLYITGGRNKDRLPDALDEDVLVAGAIAVETQMIGAVLFQVPNAPCIYHQDPFGPQNRDPNAMIALGWNMFLANQSNPFGLVLLPMTKAASKAIDAIQQIAPTYNGGVAVKNCVVAGASKRGWTTWLLAAVDKRVVAAIPIVLDALNLGKFFQESWRALGGWTFALKAWVDTNVTQQILNPKMQDLFNIIDPYVYRSRMTMPKFALMAVGDEFQVPIGRIGNNWMAQMSGVMNSAFLNGEHSCATAVPVIIPAVSAWVQTVIKGGASALPTLLTWSIDNMTGAITAETSVAPIRADVLVGDSATGVSKNRVDFRWAAVNATPCLFKVFGACVRLMPWESVTESPYLKQISPTKFVAQMPLPTPGRWRGFVLRFWFKNEFGGKSELHMTTPVSVIPMNRPFPMCTTAEQCRGHLV